MSVDNIENVDNLDISVDNLDSNLYDNVASNDNLLSVCNEHVDFTFNDEEEDFKDSDKECSDFSRCSNEVKKML